MKVLYCFTLVDEMVYVYKRFASLKIHLPELSSLVVFTLMLKCNKEVVFYYETYR